MVVQTDTGGNVSTCPVGNPIPTEISHYMVVSTISPIITSLSLGSNQSNDHNGGMSKNLHFRRLLIKIHPQSGIYFVEVLNR